MSAIGEASLGITLVAVPDVALPLLLKDSPTSSTVFLARCFGAAVLTLGISWWGARGSPAGHRMTRAGYFVFNVGIAAVAGAFAFDGTAGVVAVLAAIALLHAGLGIAYAVAAEPTTPQ